MIKTDSKIASACKQADKQAAKTGKRCYVTADGKVHEYQVACFGIVVYVTSRSINQQTTDNRQEREENIMRIKLWIETIDGEVLEELGECLTNSPTRAIELYQDIEELWADKGYSCGICYEVIDN